MVRIGAAAALVVASLPLTAVGPAAAAAPVRPAVVSGAAAGEDCLAEAAMGVCRLPVTSTPGTPYSLTVPAGLTDITVIAGGGRGAAGDDGANGGSAGLTVAEIPLTPGDTIQVWVASGGVSTQPGQGWAAGGSGRSADVHSDSGGGGGASAVANGAGTLLAVAGGGGGAGGSISVTEPGGNGGAAGLPAAAGQDGVGTTPHNKYPNAVVGGSGGCANDTACQGDGHPPEQVGVGGRGTYPDSLDAPGGGGGAGYPQPGWGGQGSDFVFDEPLVPAGGGAGGGGQNYVDGTGTVLAMGSSDRQDGYVEFRPAGQSESVTCGSRNSLQYQVPAGVTGLFAVAVGASGGTTSDPSDTGGAGAGALATASIAVAPAETLTLTAGCPGGGENPSVVLGSAPGGGGGGAEAGADDGGGGGGGSAVLDVNGDFLLTAGGGGGAGGYASNHSSTDDATGGAGGNAGLGWGVAGAGSGTEGQDGGDGGQGGAAPGAAGDTGSHGAHDDVYPGGGGGGGGGGTIGGIGGDGGATSPVLFAGGGGGGGAGASDYDPDPGFVSDPHIGTATGQSAGSVLIIPSFSSATAGVQVDLQFDGAAAGLAVGGSYGATVECTTVGKKVFGSHVSLQPGINSIVAGLTTGSICTVSQSGGDLGLAWTTTVTPPATGGVLSAGTNVFTVTDRVDFLQHFTLAYQSANTPPADLTVQMLCYVNNSSVSLSNAGVTFSGAPPPSDAVVNATEPLRTDFHFTGVSNYNIGQPPSGPGPLTGTVCYPATNDTFEFVSNQAGQSPSSFPGTNVDAAAVTFTGINSSTSPIAPSNLVIIDCSGAGSPQCPSAAARVAPTPLAATGSITVSTTSTGPAAAAARPAAVTLTCTRTDVRPARRSTTTLVLSGAGGSATVGDLPAGTLCTVREGSSGGAQHVSYSATGKGSSSLGAAPTDGVQVSAGETPHVTIANVFDDAPLTATLTRTGSDAVAHAHDVAHLVARCRTADGTTVRTAGRLAATVRQTGTVALGRVPVGSVCSARILEDVPGGFVPGAAVTVGASGARASLHQTFEATAVSISLAVSGPGAAGAARQQFGLSGRCISASRPGRPISLTGRSGVLLAGSGSGRTPAVTVPNGYLCGAGLDGPFGGLTAFSASRAARTTGGPVDLQVRIVMGAAKPVPPTTTAHPAPPTRSTPTSTTSTQLSSSTTAPPPSVPSAAPTGPALAATGVPGVPISLAAGVLALTAGGVLLLVTRRSGRRRPGRHS